MRGRPNEQLGNIPFGRRITMGRQFSFIQGAFSNFWPKHLKIDQGNFKKFYLKITKPFPSKNFFIFLQKLTQPVSSPNLMLGIPIKVLDITIKAKLMKQKLLKLRAVYFWTMLEECPILLQSCVISFNIHCDKIISATQQK